MSKRRSRRPLKRHPIRQRRRKGVDHAAKNKGSKKERGKKKENREREREREGERETAGLLFA